LEHPEPCEHLSGNHTTTLGKGKKKGVSKEHIRLVKWQLSAVSFHRIGYLRVPDIDSHHDI
jgi:hypothetical protein